MTGIEPATVGLLDQCSTDWATRAYFNIWQNHNTKKFDRIHSKKIGKKKNARCGSRTHDLRIMRPTRYQLRQTCIIHMSYNHVLSNNNRIKQKKNTKTKKNEKTPVVGIEPTTTWLRVMRSTDWAKRACLLVKKILNVSDGIRTHSLPFRRGTRYPITPQRQ